MTHHPWVGGVLLAVTGHIQGQVRLGQHSLNSYGYILFLKNRIIMFQEYFVTKI